MIINILLKKAFEGFMQAYALRSRIASKRQQFMAHFPSRFATVKLPVTEVRIHW